MTTFFTSDTHFNHSNILKYCPRRLEISQTVTEMNDYLMTAWNDVVRPQDVVYHLGDVGFGHPEELVKIIKRLHGHKYLIPGNHDQRHLKHAGFVQAWKSVLPSYHELNLDGQFMVLCHYPLLGWNKMFHQSIHVHGHVHTDYLDGSLTLGIIGQFCQHRFDVGVDHHHNYSPFRFQEIIEHTRES
jgi:calcineurin-like phosphoesterase family protein